jgi:hypothetical protein
MGVPELFIDFLRPVAVGAAAVLLVIVFLGWRMPRRAKVNARPFARD